MKKRRKPDKDPGSHATRPAAPDAALIIFAKAPIPGQVKTRLCPPLTPDEAATLHGSFVLDALERSGDAVKRSGLSLDRFIACAPSAEHAFFKVLEARHHVRLLPQVGDDLGARMGDALETVLRMGYGKALLVGTDIPTMPVTVYGQALTLLADHDLVLGPTSDGGYYVIGLKRAIPELFTNIPWSTDQTFGKTLEGAKSLGLRTGLLPACRDIDRVEDLVALIEETWSQTRPAGRDEGHYAPSVAQPISKRTAGVLKALATRLRRRAPAPSEAKSDPLGDSGSASARQPEG